MTLDNSQHLRDYTQAMKSHLVIQFVITLILFAFSTNSYAQQWYHVELIVFEQLDTRTDEQWPEMSLNKAVKLTPRTSSNVIQPAANESLLNHSSRLNRSSRYRVHYHQAWQQPIMKKNRAQSVGVNSDNNMIEGSIRLYKSTYLHAAVDLWLNENTSPVTNWSDVSPDGDSINLPRNPNLKESRRIRSNKLYLFDHPKLGAVLKLTPIETPAAMQENAQSLESFSLPAEAAPKATE